MRDKSEYIVQDLETGAKKASKLARFDLIPAEPLWTLAEHYGVNLEKYDARNWEKGYDWSLSYAAINRHLNLWWRGEDIDPDNCMPHLAAVAWHAFTLLEFSRTHPEKDDRPNVERKDNS